MKSDSCNLISSAVAIAKLQSGDCVGLPTETVYGLAADISNPSAIEKIFKIKERPFFDPLIVHVAELSQLDKVVSATPPIAKKLMSLFWPGPLTIVLPKHEVLNPMITSGLDTVGTRMPQHPLALEIIKSVGPLAAPSANKFMRVSPTRAEHVLEEFSGQVPVVNGGNCKVGIESTVVGFDDKFEKIFIYRPGAVTEQMLAKVAPVEVKQSVVAPGHLKHHYMPNVPLVLLTQAKTLTIEMYEKIQDELTALHSKENKRPPLYPALMRLPDSAELAARHLYSEMRNAESSRSYVNCIVLPYDLNRKEDALWTSITNRLTKSATLIV